MTSKELSQLYYLKREIRRQEERLYLLRTKAEKITSSISAARGGGIGADRIAYMVAAITGLEQLIQENRVKCIIERQRIEKYISSIDNSMIREIFRLRHIDCLTWHRVAIEIGGGNTADGVRMIHDRYLAK